MNDFAVSLEKDRMFVRGLPTLLEVEGLAIVRIPGVALGI